MLTWVEISASALLKNYDLFRHLHPSGVVLPVIKSNAYGHGMIEVATILEQRRHPAMFAVVNADEALLLRERGIMTPLLILSAFQNLTDLQLRSCIRQKMTFPIYDQQGAQRLSRLATPLLPANVHLKGDIGTSRLGVRSEKFFSFAQSLLRLQNIHITGIFGHLASSEDPDPAFTIEQLQTFQRLVESLKDLLPRSRLLAHVACSAAAIRFPHSGFGGIRVGLGLYGLWPSSATRSSVKNHQRPFVLHPVLSWKARILQVKDLPARALIGYGCTDRARRSTRLAILPVGYYEGWDRRLGNNGEVLIHGKRCRIRGRICMNLSMVDITGVPKPRPGDEVVLIGKQGSDSITADEIADRCKTIAYEVVSRINPLLPRKVISD